MFGFLQFGQKSSVNLGMQGFHPSIQDFRETCDRFHINNGKPGLPQDSGRTARGN